MFCFRMKMGILIIILLPSLIPSVISNLGLKNVVIVILSQENQYHNKLAEDLRNNLYEQAEIFEQTRPIIHLSHKEFPHVGGWTIIPLINQLTNLYETNKSWIIFIEDRTKIKLKELMNTLDKYDHRKDGWIGYALHDNEATIIHHFAFYENPKVFKYPNIASGFAISTTLLTKLLNRIKQQNFPTSDFAIDNAHELALFIWEKGKGELLQHENAFCIDEEQTDCATFPIPFRPCAKVLSIDSSSMYFAVKTCKKFHKDRVLVVKKTWGKYVPLLKFFSDIKDDTIPTISLGIENSEKGHCAKTLGILKYINAEIENNLEIQWVIIADDDTILSVSRLQRLLTCYNSSEPVALGERYGFNVYNSHGYNYITGGGGMVFSRSVIKQLTKPGICECPSLDTPDDMYIGICLLRIGVTITHSPYFHQARPQDYPSEYLQTRDAVTFHKHWMIDPVQVYNEWFVEEDKRLLKSDVQRTEL